MNPLSRPSTPQNIMRDIGVVLGKIILQEFANIFSLKLVSCANTLGLSCLYRLNQAKPQAKQTKKKSYLVVERIHCFVGCGVRHIAVEFDDHSFDFRCLSNRILQKSRACHFGR